MQKLSLDDSKTHESVLEALKSGGIVIIPTDTVYGIACDAENKNALAGIFEIKKRDPEKRIALLVADIEMAERVVALDPVLKERFRDVWPGAFTGIFMRKDGAGTEGVRVPQYPFVQNLSRALGRPIAATSANLSGDEPYTKIADIIKIFGNDARIAIIVDADDLPDSMASTVVDFTKSPPAVLRTGLVDPKQFL